MQRLMDEWVFEKKLASSGNFDSDFSDYLAKNKK